MLSANNTVFVLVDIQEKLIGHIDQNEMILENCAILIQGLKLLDVPIIWLEQYPKGLGPTCEPLKSLLDDQYEPIAKVSFSGFKSDAFQAELKQLKEVKNIIIAGIESHICVYQTARDLLSMGYNVELIDDCISSRTPENYQIGITKMQEMGASISSVETLLFELMESSKHENFKEISELIK